MLRLGEPRQIAPPPPDPFEERAYPSPSGAHTLLFSNAREYAMGATFWDTVLVDRRGKKKRLPHALSIAPLIPWSSDGTRFAYLATKRIRDDGRLLLGDIREGVGWPSVSTWATGIFWSPTRPLLLAVANGWRLLLDRNGGVVASDDWATPPHDAVFAGWLACGEHFFVISRTPESRTMMRVFDERGTQIDTQPLDPADLVPYDCPAYLALPRGGFVLRTGPGTRSIGALLDRWFDARYDAESGDLALAVYRPTGAVGPDPSPTLGAFAPLTAPAAVSWIAVRITE